jgi:hypothetical protein
MWWWSSRRWVSRLYGEEVFGSSVSVFVQGGLALFLVSALLVSLVYLRHYRHVSIVSSSLSGNVLTY